MPLRCAVSTCRSWTDKPRKDLGLSFFRFPKEKTRRAAWVHKCARADMFNVDNAADCSEHFLEDDYDPSYLVKRTLVPDTKPMLRSNAVPSRHLPSSISRKDGSRAECLKGRQTQKEVTHLLEDGAGGSTMDNTDPPVQQKCARRPDLAARVKFLQKKLAVQAAVHRRRMLSWRREKARLLREVQKLRAKASATIKLQEGGILSDNQVQRLATNRRLHWTARDVANAVGLRCISRKAYGYAQQVMKLPLPCCRTLQRWTRGFRVMPGIIEASVEVIDAAVHGITMLEKLCVVSFDEVALDARWCHDQTMDQVMSASKLQVMMVRSLCGAWKQPCFFAFDAPMTVETLTQVVVRLEELGLVVVAAVSDMGPSNETMWRQAGVGHQKSWISHPADQSRRLWVFADVPHLVKLLRTHVMMEGGGLLVPNSRGGHSLLARQPFEDLLSLEQGDLRVCHKLTRLCVEATGQASQRVHLATRAFSGSVSAAMARHLPGRQTQAEAVAVVNAWFDTLNSRTPYDAKLERCSFGISAAAKTAQDAALNKMDDLMSQSRKVSPKQPLGRASLLPFQHGILRSSSSLRGLYQDLQAVNSDLKYLMTSHLNQDCLENLFSQLRGICGANTTPDAVEARARLRILLMAPSPLQAVSSGRAVQPEEHSSFLSTGQKLQQPGYLSSAAVDGLNVQLRDPDDINAESERKECEEALQRAMPARPVAPTDPASASSGVDNVECSDEGMEQEAMAFVAGFVASKCRHIDSSLGLPTTSALPSDLAAVPSGWIATISRGQLFVPSAWWMEVVRDFRDSFLSIMGPNADQQPGILRRLIQLIQHNHPRLDQRVARKLASTLLHLRLRQLNARLAEAKAQRKAGNKVRQHIKNAK